eukprot:363961-Chlamydomonas_euryale.AAC.3
MGIKIVSQRAGNLRRVEKEFRVPRALMAYVGKARGSGSWGGKGQWQLGRQPQPGLRQTNKRP